MKKFRFTWFNSSFLFVVNILDIFLVPFAASNFDGLNKAGIRCNIEFRVSLIGSWIESRLRYSPYTVGSSSGIASDIGIYNHSIIILISVALFLSLIGTTMIWSPFEKGKNRQLEKLNIDLYKLLRLIGAFIAIISSILGIIGLSLYGSFKQTITQPFYEYFPSDNIPVIRLWFGFYICLLCFIIYLFGGIATLFFNFKKTEITPSENKIHEIDIKHTANLLVFNNRINIDDNFADEIVNSVSENHILILFQNIVELLIEAQETSNELLVISKFLIKIGAKDLLSQIELLVSQYKSVESKKIAELLLEHIKQ